MPSSLTPIACFATARPWCSAASAPAGTAVRSATAAGPRSSCRSSPARPGLAAPYGHRRPGDAELGGFRPALAPQCAEARERARLYEGEHRARERAEALGTAISVLAGGAVASEVAELVAREAVRTLGAGSAGVMVPVGRMRMLRSAAVAGYPDELVRPAEPVKLVMGSPAADCMLSRGPAVVAQPGEGTSIVALPMIA